MQEIPIKQLFKTITWKRLNNAAKAVTALVVSTLTKRTLLWGRPFILTIEPTNICNLRCPLCVTGNGSMQRPAGNMTFKTFQKTIDDLGDYLFYILLYHQGEPFINKDFLSFVRYAKQRRIFVTTSTNGHYLDRETATDTVASGLDSLIISMDGTSQASYSKYRVGGDFEKVKAGVRRLVEERKRQQKSTPVIFLQFIVLQHNEQEIPRMKKLAHELGADKLLVKNTQVETVVQATEWLPKPESFRRYKITGNELMPKRRGTGPCPRPWTSTLVNWNGSVVPCCFDKNARFQMGTINGAKNINEIWNSNRYADFRKQLLSNRSAIDICANCSQGLQIYF